MTSKVRVGIVGVGNCASSFVQGLTYYRDATSNEPVPGLMNVSLGGYHISDIELSVSVSWGLQPQSKKREATSYRLLMDDYAGAAYSGARI